MRAAIKVAKRSLPSDGPVNGVEPAVGNGRVDAVRTHLKVEDVAPVILRILRIFRWIVRHERTVFGGGMVLLVLGCWQLCSDENLVNSSFASSPSRVAIAFWSYIQSKAFRTDISYSGEHFLFGFGLAVIVGIVIGLMLGWFRKMRLAFNYLLSIANATPTIALVPLIVIWLGIGAKTDIAIVFVIAVFPVIVTTMNGVRTIDRDIIDMAYSMGVRRWRLCRTILIPAALPSITSGVRLAVAAGLIGVVVSEFMAGTAGIGYMMNNAATLSRPADVFVGLFIIAVAGLLLTGMVGLIEKRVRRWHT